MCVCVCVCDLRTICVKVWYMTEYNRDFTKPENLKHLGTYSFCYFWFSREDSFAYFFKKISALDVIIYLVNCLINQV